MKICPKCNKEWPDEFMACPLDGTALITKPQQPAGFSLNLGDANAISGGVNMSDNHSVSNNTVNTTTSNVDSHNVITNNITQVEREKTAEELKHEKELAFREECLKVYSNGIMTSEGKRKLDDLRYRLGLDENTANKILSEVTKRSERKSSSLSPVHQITYYNIKTAIIANRLDLVDRLMAQLKAMVQRYSAEEIQFTYYMLQAVLHPKECTEEYESHYEDKYWQTFWSSIAYRRLGNIEKSELLVADVGDKWTDTIPQENVFVLATVNALIDKDMDTAKSLFDNIGGEHSPYLSNLATCLYTLIYGDMLSPEELKQMKKDSVFYTKNLFAEINEYHSEKKRLEAEAEAKRVAKEKKLQEETERLAKEKKKQEEAEALRVAEEKNRKAEAERIAEESTKKASAVTKFDTQLMLPYIDEFGYLRKLDASGLAELKSVLLTVPKNNYQAKFLLGQLYIQENTSASNLRLAYDAIKSASEHGIYEAGAFMAYFYLYGKVVPQDLDEAERRIKIDDDFKKNPIFVQMMVDLYVQKGNAMLADVWKSKLKKFK
ncbi:hypothetical protein ST42_01985 [Prevotella pectinovora]|uniref:Uncharacterized protein n=1 Tax=Prevotella pectinovora TaxID=1602169 RepID=A0A0D0HC97_9BACT|nr:hypothetical protein [Prevotella pectinovora]KIP58301.1 hypothetical protein ST42_01985 [Prevotella pectinovora]KIP62037.1 hypothetical protein ST44_07935 [Prevotella pectinovora]